MNPDEQKVIIHECLQEEATIFKTAGETLRASTDGEERAKALGERLLRLERLDALLDAYSEVSNGRVIQ